MKILSPLKYIKLKGCTTNFPKSKKIGFRYSTPALKGVNKSQFFLKSPLGDLGVKKGNLSYTQLKKLGILVGFIAIVVLINCKKEEQGNEFHTPLSNTADGPPAGNPAGLYPIPSEGEWVDVSVPDQIVGTGTPDSCTAQAFTDAVAKGGKIVFNGGTAPFTITLTQPANIFNDANTDVVIDGGGIVTLSGGGRTRILYMNTCDENQHWTTDHCQNQDNPRLTVQNITFADGNSTTEKEFDGGGAIWVRGGRFKAVNCRFFNNHCGSKGADIGGGALRVFSQYNNLPVYLVNCTFGGAGGYGNVGSNGGAISSIGVSWTIINCLFTHNSAIGIGGNPAQSGTPGGGSGGAIYNDGNTMTLSILGTRIEQNEVNAYGSAIFFVTNDHSGDIKIDKSTIINNIGGSWYPVYPGISMHSDTRISVANSTIE
jgi:hypothetical protein